MTLVDLFQRGNLELNLGLGQSEIGFARPNSHRAENGDGDVVVARCAPSFLPSFTCFMFSRLQRDLGTSERARERDSSFPGGVSSSPLARPGQFMKIKPIPPPPSVQNSWRAKMERERERERVEQLSLMIFNHERKSERECHENRHRRRHENCTELTRRFGIAAM